MNSSAVLTTHLAAVTRALTSAAAASSAASATTIKWKWRQSPPRQAAVLLPLVATPTHPHDLHVLFTVRSARLRAHRGEVSFPGGMMDPEDASLYDAARREVHEELGVTLPVATRSPPMPSAQRQHAHTGIAADRGLLGDLTPLPDKSLTISVHPYVSYLGTLDLQHALRVNPHEVAAVFTLPLRYLVNPHNIKTAKPTAKRKLSLGRAIYWRVPEDTVVYVAPETDASNGPLKAVTKREFLHEHHLESAVDDVGHVSDSAASQGGPAAPSVDDMDHMDVWGLTAFITKEFVSILQKEGVNQMLLNNHPTTERQYPPPTFPTPTFPSSSSSPSSSSAP